MFIFFFIGVASLQLLFIAYQFAVLKRKEFIYYFCYVFFITLFVSATLLPQYNPFHWMVNEESPYLLGRVNLALAFAMYFNFGRQFTNTKKLYPRFDNRIRYTIYIIYSIAFTDLLLLSLGYSYNKIDQYIQYCSIVLAVTSVYAIVYLISRKQILTTILVVGSLLLLAFASVGLVLSLFIIHRKVTYTENVFYIEIGIMLEFLFLTYGLIYKTRLIEKENLNLIIYQQEEINKERKRIIADLHDDIGSTLSSISIFSELAEKHYISHPEQSREMITRISQQTRNLMLGIEDIILSLKPFQIGQFSLLNRIQEYAAELLSGKKISFSIFIDPVIEHEPIYQPVLRSLLLIIKEAFNNIAKYSEATNVEVSMNIEDNRLVIFIHDNGKGFEHENSQGGNGLMNMKKRCEDIKGEFSINSSISGGTTICCRIPVASIRHEF